MPLAALEAEGATVVDGMDIDLSATANEFPALLCEFKTDIATYLETYVDGTNPVTGEAYPQTLAELIEFNQAHPELEGPWNDLVFELAEATNGRDARLRRPSRKPTTPPVQDAIQQVMADNELDAIIALTNGPAWPTNDNPDEGDLDGHFEYFVGSSTAAAVSGYADITVPAGTQDDIPPPTGIADRDHLHRRPLVRAGADRLRLRLRAGDAGSCPAAVHPDDRRRSVPRRPEPGALAQAQRQQAPQVSAISSCASGRGTSRRQRSPAIRPGFVGRAKSDDFQPGGVLRVAVVSRGRHVGRGGATGSDRKVEKKKKKKKKKRNVTLRAEPHNRNRCVENYLNIVTVQNERERSEKKKAIHEHTPNAPLSIPPLSITATYQRSHYQYPHPNTYIPHHTHLT